MSDTGFELDAGLAGDTVYVADLALCRVLLMNDARFPWLVLVPRQPGKVEIADLSPADQATLWHEVNLASSALRSVGSCDKLNIGALGNIVRQLHVHVVARQVGDTAWPGPVWGSGKAIPYAVEQTATLSEALRNALE